MLSPTGLNFDREVENTVFHMKVKREAQKQVESKSLEGITIPEGVLADGPIPENPSEMIPGILLTNGCTGIIGEKEVGKSLVALEIEHSLVTGYPLWGAIEPQVKLQKTVHFLAEHSSATLMELYRRMQLPATGKMRIFGPEHLGAMKLLVSGGQRREEAVEFYKRLADGAGLVVFDPLAAFIQGESAENDNSPMRNLIDTMIEIGASTGASCLILGHKGKPQMFQGRMVPRGSYATRGASAIEDAMAAVHYLGKLPDVKIQGNVVFELKPVHYKGKKHAEFQLIRDKNTCVHTLNTSFKIKSYNNGDDNG